MINKVAINSLLLENQNIDAFSDDILVYDNLFDVRNKSSYFFFGTISDCVYLNNLMFGCCSYWNLSVSEFLPFIKDSYVNYDGYYKHCCQLNSNDCGKFCKSNAGNKTWSGQIIQNKWDISFIQSKLQSDDLLYISSLKIITNECRYWINNDKIVGKSLYSNTYIETNKSLEYDKYVNNLISNWGPDSMYTIDICTFNDCIYVMEYNCFSTSGFYQADVNGIVRSVLDTFKNE